MIILSSVMDQTTKNTHQRTIWMLIVLTTAFIVIILRLFYWQIVQKEKLTVAAYKQHWSQIFIPAPRGLILADDYQPLVTNQPAYTVFLDRKNLQTPEAELINKLIQTLPEDPENITSESARLNQILTTQQNIWLKLFPTVDQNTYDKIKALELNGLFFQPATLRKYPEASSAAHLLGFVAANSADKPQGYFGLEGFYDREISGQAGRLSIETDAYGNPIVLGERQHQKNPPR